MDYEITRSKRKTIALYIAENGQLMVKAPNNASKMLIEDVVEKHKHWIINKQKETLERNAEVQKKQFLEGEQFLFLGGLYLLHITNYQKECLIFKEKFYLSSTCLDNATEAFIRFYKKEAYKKILESVSNFSKFQGLALPEIKITKANKRWGSCSPKGNLSFTYRLIMAPIDIIDYVVVHELSHIQEHNHSKAFYKKIEEILPNYRDYEKWLKQNGHLLRL
jgi:predicted metal-dependent hydrolase